LYILGAWMGREARRIVTQIERFGLEDEVHHLAGMPNRLVAPLYAGATALLYPSLMEGFGLPLLEAMRCETAVITSDRSSMPEVCGDAALYVNPEDTCSLTDRMHLLAANSALREDLIARGRVRSALFSWERTAAATLTAYARFTGLGAIAGPREQSLRLMREETDAATTHLTAV
ncbi:MAG: glycosyltransferase, partial [Ktedonobacterales bacterium]